MVASTMPETSLLDGFAQAIAAHDFESISKILHPEIRFRALTPNDTIGLSGSSSAIAEIIDWFGDRSPIEVISSEVESINDRIRLAYRFRACRNNEWAVLEQQCFCIVTDGLIADISIVCTGYRPEP